MLSWLNRRTTHTERERERERSRESGKLIERRGGRKEE
jgi:hypothetical protein